MFVLASDGTPLDPCRPARARKLLAAGRAVVARHTPFTIRLKDLVRAIVPKGKYAGTHTGRVAVRTSGSHTVQTATGPIKTLYKHLRLLQRADGYAYMTQREQHPCAP
ncbi:RRXRR domain-containing protein [Nonomuraea sp. NPDC049784]|uniref:RRXRR domain-containing protein n=1 Tax=Nonomuraea sp. NPDC049784 TaxID=3154361 RepID=UPI0033F5DE2D